jgi:dihydrofolate reductase
VGKLIYLMNVSLDGFIESPERTPDWVPIDDEVHGWFNDQTRHQGAEIYGRRMYEVMLDYARVWNATPKLVFSSTLDRVEWNSRLATGDPADELARLRSEVDGDIGVSGPTIAAAFVKRGLVDEYGLMVHPVVLGAGTPYWPAGIDRMDLELRATRTFTSGAVYLNYAVRR